MENGRNRKEDELVVKMFVWKRKLIYVWEWKLELEWFYNVEMKYMNNVMWIRGGKDDVFNVVGWIEGLVNR